MRNLFRLKKLKKTTNNTTIKDLRNLSEFLEILEFFLAWRYKEPLYIKKRKYKLKIQYLKTLATLMSIKKKNNIIISQGITIILNIKVMVIEKQYWLKNFLIQLDYT